MGSLNAFTVLPSIRAAGLDLQFASGLFTAQGAVSGWNLSSDKAPPFSSPLQPQTSAERRTSAKPCFILLVEDNSGDVGLVREALAEYRVDCDIAVVSDGEKAMEFVDDADIGRLGRPDLVILDLNLPRRSGHEVLMRIRSSNVLADVPVIVLTSSNAQRDRQEAAALGATRYVRKPLLLEDFLKLGGLFQEMLAETK